MPVHHALTQVRGIDNSCMWTLRHGFLRHEGLDGCTSTSCHDEPDRNARVGPCQSYPCAPTLCRKIWPPWNGPTSACGSTRGTSKSLQAWNTPAVWCRRFDWRLSAHQNREQSQLSGIAGCIRVDLCHVHLLLTSVILEVIDCDGHVALSSTNYNCPEEHRGQCDARPGCGRADGYIVQR
jgi:hypothetical protein